ncbi:MAG: hypothetical protein IKJ11_11070 [Clostridia bacterium]|nr:hypothetical protein [Clostridia bacterium]
MRMGIVMQRRKRRRAARMRSAILISAMASAVAALTVMTMHILPGGIADGLQAFSQQGQIVMTLPGYDVYALQLAVFDHGERAAAEAARLQKEGVRCVIWQREKMRIIVSAACEKDQLDRAAAGGYEAYVIRDSLEEIPLRLSARADDAAMARRLLETPDAVFAALTDDGQTTAGIAAQTRMLAEEALGMQVQNALYTQLAQSLISWCDIVQDTLEVSGEAAARSYGALTMCTICRQLRQTLSEPSTASAQRTPSTAADVMPPA